MKVEETNFVTHLIIKAVLDPDLEIRWGGRSSSPLHKGVRSLKNFFPPFGPQFGLKIGGGGPPGPPLDLPLYSTIISLNISEPVC